MMVSRQMRLGKAGMNLQCADPPWDENHPQWQSIDDRLPPDHLARQIDEAVDRLDLSPLWESYQGRGSPPLRPDLMLKIALYEMQCGKPSPAEWFRDSREGDAVKWLGFGIQPSRAVWYKFRDRFAKFLDTWNEEVLQIAIEQGFTTARRGALDGSTMAACASRYKTVRSETLDRRSEELNQTIAQDEQERSPDHVPRWMAKHPQTRRQQQRRYQRVQERMEQLQAENQQRRASKRKDPQKIRVSVSDPDSALGRDKLKVFRPLYNVQIVRDLDSPFLLGYGTFNCVTDTGTLEPMLERTTQLSGWKPKILLADATYATILDLEICQQHGVVLYAPVSENDYSEKNQKKRSTNQFTQLPKTQFTWLAPEQTFVCPENHRLKFERRTRVQRRGGRSLANFTYRCPSEHCCVCVRRDQCTPTPEKGRTVSRLENEELLDDHRARMETTEAKALYRLRGQTVEHGFADMKEHRNFRRLSGRGLWRARAQTAATVLVHNLLALLKTEKETRGTKPTTTRALAPITG
jgi:transposase